MHAKLHSETSKHILLLSADQFLPACNEAAPSQKLLSAFGSLVHVKIFYNLMRIFLFFFYLFRSNKCLEIFFPPHKFVCFCNATVSFWRPFVLPSLLLAAQCLVLWSTKDCCCLNYWPGSGLFACFWLITETNLLNKHVNSLIYPFIIPHRSPTKLVRDRIWLNVLFSFFSVS